VRLSHITPHLSLMYAGTHLAAGTRNPGAGALHIEEKRMVENIGETHALTMEPMPGEPDRRRQSQIGNTSRRGYRMNGKPTGRSVCQNRFMRDYQ